MIFAMESLQSYCFENYRVTDITVAIITAMSVILLRPCCYAEQSGKVGARMPGISWNTASRLDLGRLSGVVIFISDRVHFKEQLLLHIQWANHYSAVAMTDGGGHKRPGVVTLKGENYKTVINFEMRSCFRIAKYASYPCFYFSPVGWYWIVMKRFTVIEMHGTYENVLTKYIM